MEVRGHIQTELTIATGRINNDLEGRGVIRCDHSILLHPEASQNGTNYSVTYRPPNFHERLVPGESRPRFWLNSSDNEPHAPIVSVAWSQSHSPSLSTRLMRRSNVKRSKTSSKKADDSPNVESLMCGLHHNQDTENCGDNNLVIPTYPQFLAPFVQKVIRIRLISLDVKASEMVGAYSHLRQGQQHCDPSTETSCLIRNMHSLRLNLRYSSSVKGLPEVSVDENHGGLKRLKKVRYRRMHVTWLDMDHRKDCFRAVGENFQLFLEAPSPNLNVEDFPDGNGELPSALGVYSRNLDTAPNTKLKFSARIFSWYIQTAPAGDPLWDFDCTGDDLE